MFRYPASAAKHNKRMWNVEMSPLSLFLSSLPPHILQSQTLSSFRRHLKTHYFQSAYPAPIAAIPITPWFSSEINLELAYINHCRKMTTAKFATFSVSTVSHLKCVTLRLVLWRINKLSQCIFAFQNYHIYRSCSNRWDPGPPWSTTA